MKKEKKISLLSALKTQWWLVREQDEIKYKIVKGFTDVCFNLPIPIRKKVLTFIDHFMILFSRCFLIISRLFLTAYIVSGKEKHTGIKITILYIGNEKLFPYLSNILFSKEPTIEKRFNLFIWNISKNISQNEMHLDAVVIKSDRFYSHYFEKQGYTIIPEWISTTLDISNPLENIYKKFSKSIKEDIRKIKKYKFTYEICEDSKKLKTFYNQMYLPYITWKYGKFIKYANFYTIKHIFGQGGKILFIKRNNNYLFGGLFLRKKDEIYATYAGVMKNKFDCINQGITAGSYYFLINYAKEIGVKLINFGSCRPFFNDGLFSYKRKWGVKIDKTGNENADIYSIKVLRNNKGIESFFKNNPFISLLNSRICTKFIEKID